MLQRAQWNIARSPSFDCLSLPNLSFQLYSEFHLGNDVIKITSEHKDLGILVTSNLCWSSHITSICGKSYASLALIKKSLPSWSKVSIKRSLYISLVRSKLTYCSQIWRPSLIKDIRRIENVQRSLNIFPLARWLEFQDILFLVKC